MLITWIAINEFPTLIFEYRLFRNVNTTHSQILLTIDICIFIQFRDDEYLIYRLISIIWTARISVRRRARFIICVLIWIMWLVWASKIYKWSSTEVKKTRIRTVLFHFSYKKGLKFEVLKSDYQSLAWCTLKVAQSKV